VSRIIREYILPCYEEAGLLWVHGIHGKVGKNEEVVRCRNCQSLIDCGDHYICVMWGCPTEPDGYCHKGEGVDNDRR